MSNFAFLKKSTTKNKSTASTVTRNSSLDEAMVFRILDSTPAAVSILDLQSKKLVYANKLAEELMGYSFEEMNKMGQDIFTRLHPDDLEEHMKASQELSSLKTDEIRNYSYRVINKKNQVLRLAVRRMVFKRAANGLGTQVLSMSEVIGIE